MKQKSKILIGSIAVLAALIAGYVYLDSILFDGVKPRSINDDGFQASFFAKGDIENQAAIVLIGGGNWGDYWGQEFAKANYVGLSLPYTRQEGLPELPEDIPLEYFQKAMDWLKQQPEVNPDKIVVMGASRNAELALLLASYYPETVHGVIAYSPSSVSWSNTVFPFNSDEVKPSWTIDNQAVPFIPMQKIKGPRSSTVETLPYWQKGLSDSSAVREASIQVEHIHGPILLFSGLEDEVWPSAMMSDMIETRIKNNPFEFEIENIQYEHAGHLISGNPNNPSSMRQGNMMIDGNSYDFNFGGTEEGDMAAQKDASRRIFQFLSKL
ncbi:MAG: acyl-CoA thioester hydrolase/BAAT C-terminal domain-containing protein [Bacteroidota bacterium]